MADDNLVELIYKSPIKSFMSAWQVKNEVELNWETINNVWKFIQAHKYLGRIPLLVDTKTCISDLYPGKNNDTSSNSQEDEYWTNLSYEMLWTLVLRSDPCN